MKILNKAVLLALLVFAGTVQAQQTAENKRTAPKLPFGQSMLRLKQASDLIVKASIPEIKKPFTVGIDLAAQMQKAREQCPYLRQQRPTLHLEGERNSNSDVHLEWETTNGWNNQAFQVQRSLGDSFHFETVNAVLAKQIAGIKDRYTLPDDNDYKKVSYYRVRLEFRNGAVLYSNVAPVKGYEINSLSLYPNPGSGRVILTLFSDQAGPATIKIFDAGGSLVTQQSESLSEGFNSRVLNVASLASGYYPLKVLMPDKTERSIRLVRQ